MLFLFVTMATSQTFEFRFQGMTVEDGATVTIPAEEDEFGFGELCCVTNPSENPNNGLILTLLNGQSAKGSATLSIGHNSLNAAVIKWCMGGECSIINDKTSFTKQFNVSGGSVQVQFDAENIRNGGYLLASLKATIGLESHSVNILFTNGESPDIPTPPNRCDVNKDTKVDISDVVAVINSIAGTNSEHDCDVNEDNKTDISDIVAIINHIASKKS